MQPKDYISMLALFVAGISLLISIYNTSFSRRTKLVELRVMMLSKLSEASVANKRLKMLSKDFLDIAKKNEDERIIKAIDNTDLEIIQSDLDSIYSTLSNIEVKSAMFFYENQFHHIGNVYDRIISIENGMKNEKARYEKHLTERRP